MRILLTAAIAGILAGAASAQRPVSEHGTLTLHYVQKAIGSERWTLDRAGDEFRLASNFEFTDRGGQVALTGSLRTRSDYTPRQFTATGKSYRFVNVDSQITVDGTDATVRDRGRSHTIALPPAFYTVDGYAPFAAQMLMMRYWLQHGKPRVLQTIPSADDQHLNDVIIEARGRDTIHVGAMTYPLDRYSIDGVVWGRETLWLDASGTLAAVITRAGGLSFEAVREDLEPALRDFVIRGTEDRLRDLASITSAVPPVRTGTYALTGATIVDATDRPPIRDGVVIVGDGRITDVGARDAVHVPAGVPIVDVTGRTIVPGLWDMHTHVTQIEWAPVYLGAGVTTVRDMGNEFEFLTALRSAIDAKHSVGPRILAAGLVDGGGPNAFGVYDAPTPEDGRRLVARYHDAGFQQIKIYNLVLPAVVEAICAEAHRLGMTVTGHVPNAFTIEQAVTAGMDHIAHLAIRGEAGTPDVDRTIAFLRDHHTVMDPTQSWNELLGHALGAPIDAFQPGVAKIPGPLNRLFSSAGAADIDAATARSRLERGLRIVRELHDQGVPIVAGTDEGIPGHSLHREIELYAEAGLTPLEALRAATIVPARAMKLDAELGTIERGKRADLVVLDANPLDRIQNIRTVRWTISGGRMYDAASLWKSVRFTP